MGFLYRDFRPGFRQGQAKARELGLSSSARFANCIGLYDPDNVCTVYDMAMILWAAMENDVCRTFLTERNRVLPPNGVREEELEALLKEFLTS